MDDEPVDERRKSPRARCFSGRLRMKGAVTVHAPWVAKIPKARRHALEHYPEPLPGSDEVCPGPAGAPAGSLRMMLMMIPPSTVRPEVVDVLRGSVAATVTHGQDSAQFRQRINKNHVFELGPEAHRRQRFTASHGIVQLGLSELMKVRPRPTPSVSGQADSMLLSIKCLMHSEHQLKLFCTTCHQVICGEWSTPGLPLNNSDLGGQGQEVDAFVDEYVAALEEHRCTLSERIGNIRQAKMKIIMA
uniref:Uncharacterized protein n=1 Tax=Anopheles coluzzii TaxID=1518534 RepID=A0A8W7PQW9_ANOCL